MLFIVKDFKKTSRLDVQKTVHEYTVNSLLSTFVKPALVHRLSSHFQTKFFRPAAKIINTTKTINTLRRRDNKYINDDQRRNQ